MKELHLNIAKAFKRRRPGGLQNLEESHDFFAVIDELITEAFHETDMQYQKKFGELSKQCGSTAVVCLIIGQKIVCANLGDARALMCRNGKAMDLSVDYKASRKDEQERIKNQGGYIVFGRVLGRLAVTRAFGDFECKQIPIKNEQTGQ